MGEIEKLAESFINRAPQPEGENQEKAREYVKHLFFATLMHFLMEKAEDFILAENSTEKMIRHLKMVAEIQKCMKAEMAKNSFKTY
jgi:hypothetical protein